MSHILIGNDEREVWLDGKWLDPALGQAINNHSPDGFNWGYLGSGPAQLALSIMLALTGKIYRYQEFKENVIAKIPAGKFKIEFDFKHIIKGVE